MPAYTIVIDDCSDQYLKAVRSAYDRLSKESPSYTVGLSHRQLEDIVCYSLYDLPNKEYRVALKQLWRLVCGLYPSQHKS